MANPSEELRHELHELQLEMRAIKRELQLEMRAHTESIIRWMIGIFCGAFILAGGLLSLLLTGLYHLYGLRVPQP